MNEIHSTRPRVSMGVIGGRLPVARLRAHGDASASLIISFMRTSVFVAILDETIMYKTIIKVANLMKFR